jgi:hypothetical protein
MAPRLPRRVVVREVVPGRLLLVLLALFLLLLGAASAGWFGGRWLLVEQLGGSDASGTLERLLEENRAMRDEVAVARGGSELTREVEERVRLENLQLQDRVAELEQAVAAYRRLGFPDPAGSGLRLAEVDVARSGAGWELSLLLVRLGGTDGTLSGRLEGTLIGDSPQGRVSLPLSGMLPPGTEEFSVRYVKEWRQPLRVPTSFVPARLDFAAAIETPRPARVAGSWPRRSGK